jgi:hypothetical protein
MKASRIYPAAALAAAATMLLVIGASSEAATINVACPGQTVQAAVDSAAAGDTVAVTGVCNENVLIRNEKQRIALSGSGATISGPNAASPTLNIRGKGIVVSGFTITGGRDGVHINRGSNATIQSSTIQGTGRHGILVDQLGFAIITGNTIQNNLSGSGIVVSENSIARIGFNSDSDASASPNTIQGNGRGGIVVSRTSSARIVGNNVLSNTGGIDAGHGIQVVRLSQADIASNTINSNAGSAVYTAQNGGVNLGEDSPSSFFDQPNLTTSNNTGNGVRCDLGAYAQGHLGNSNQLNGTAGQLNINGSCPGTLGTP